MNLSVDEICLQEKLKNTAHLLFVMTQTIVLQRCSFKVKNEQTKKMVSLSNKFICN